MQVSMTLTEEDLKKLSSYALEKRLSLSSAARLLMTERFNQLDVKQ